MTHWRQHLALRYLHAVQEAISQVLLLPPLSIYGLILRALLLLIQVLLEALQLPFLLTLLQAFIIPLLIITLPPLRLLLLILSSLPLSSPILLLRVLVFPLHLTFLILLKPF